MVNDKFKEKLKIIVDIAAIITLIVLIFQTIATRDAVNLTKEEMENRLRPWIGRDDVLGGVPSQDINGNPIMVYTFKFKNYGGIPAINSNVRYGINTPLQIINPKKPISTKDLPDMEPVFFGTIMPEEVRLFNINIPISRVNETKNNNSILYIMVYINYEYAKNKSGVYSIIAEYTPHNENFIIINDRIE